MSDQIDHAGLRRLLRRQDGVLNQEQADGLGITAASARRRVASGAWVRVAHRVYRSAEHPDGARARLRAAMLSLGPGAVVVGATAAWWWRLVEAEPERFEIAVAPECRPRARSGVLLLRRRVATDDTVVVDGVRCTKRAVTALTAAISLPLVEGAALLDRVLGDGGVTLEDLRDAHLRTAGRRGTERARELLALAAGRARSEAERTAHRLLEEAGIAGWAVNLRVRLSGFGVVELDLAFAAHRLVIEIDGWAYHRTLRAFLRDGRRQNALMLAGWTVLRTTWFDLVRNPEAFIATVRAALDLPSAMSAGG